MEFDGPARYEPARHDVSASGCRSEAQASWLRTIARTAMVARTAVVYVVTPVGETRVVGYYALAAASVRPEEAPRPLLKPAGKRPVPVALVARLGVDTSARGHGLGAALVMDAMLRARQAAGIIGARALLVQAESGTARDFYLHIAESDESPADPLHLVLLMSDIEAVVSATTLRSLDIEGLGGQDRRIHSISPAS